jgi:hypothetical protein
MIEHTATGWTFVATRGPPTARRDPRAAEGVPAPAEIHPGLRHDIPSREDCLACHGGRAVPILGMTPLRRRPTATRSRPRGDRRRKRRSRGFRASRLIRGVPADGHAPRVAARTPRERAVLGYLSSNCATCHVASRPIPDVDLSLVTRLEGEVPATGAVLPTAVGRPSRFRLRETGGPQSVRIVPGRPDRSCSCAAWPRGIPSCRCRRSAPASPTPAAVSLLEVWIREDLGADVGSPAALTATPPPASPSLPLPMPLTPR